MSNRLTKKAKVSEAEYQFLNELVTSKGCTLFDYIGNIVSAFLKNEALTKDIGFLKPKRSSISRTFWFSEALSKEIKVFAGLKDTSQSTVIYTALKRHLEVTDQVC